MTPTGVEHENGEPPWEESVGDSLMTPTGVEHSRSRAALHVLGDAIPSMTPTGVEHSLLGFQYMLHDPRDSFDDADRR